ncbi:MarR family transcriptional regulator [Solirubrobacter phytolaccae]|uniref:MarR family transcriptional regulator n=1 Tax=Solirubrobacter phytolaccae TaxID=1404360 RepID=A0A9X3NKE5_9ACTN|nr:MarR family transcriptional regulator [Solirubrobacter phytolaccae]MDA0183012.1 MarR family transcriptional regulator [Solirubrobacter phytolaccae]
MPEPVEDLVIALYRLGRVQRAIARDALAELGGQGFAALAVVHRDGPARVSEVAEHLSVDLSVASRQVAALALAGYVEREPDPDDRRATRIHLTTAGTRVLRDSHRRMVATAETALNAWSAQDVTSLAAQLERLREDFAAVASLPIQKDAA